MPIPSDPVRVVVARSYVTIRCPTCGGSRPETLSLITPEIRESAVLGVTRGGELLVSAEVEVRDLPPDARIPPRWLLCTHCSTHFPLPAGIYVRLGDVADRFYGDLSRFDDERITQEQAARPIPLVRKVA